MYKVEAVTREADPQPWEFEYGGEVYQLPSDIDMRVVAALDGGRLDDAFRMLLGPEQWARLQDSECMFGPQQFGDLMQAYFEDLGLDQAKPLASTVSSKSTETRSKPISNGRTTSRSRPSERRNSHGAVSLPS
jgi:hypothetical protein